MFLRKAYKLFLFFIFLGFFYFSIQSLQAVNATGWNEEFDSILKDDWFVYENGGDIDLDARPSWLLLDSSAKSYPYLYTKNNPFVNFNEFNLEIAFQYTSITPWGTGVMIGSEALQNNPSLQELIEKDAKIAQFKIWQDDKNGLLVQCHPYENEDMSDSLLLFQLPADTKKHTLIISKVANKYRVYLDGIETLTNVEEINRTPSVITIGNPRFMDTGKDWTDINIDYIRISEPGASPLVLLPGLGASWNTEAMVYKGTVGNGQWKMTPFVNVYDRFIETAKNNGYALGDNFFVWNYDWRKSIPKITEDLDSFIKTTPGLENAEKIDFVGHSLGGLVARTWSQSHGEKVDELITVGSPHKGAVQAYEALAGGKVSDKVDVGWLAMQLLLQIHRQGFETNAEVIRNLAPVLKDINPTFNFIKKYRRQIPVNQTAYFNDFLDQLNQSQNILGFSHFVLGNTGKTVPEWLFVKNRSSLDEILDLWPDGKTTKIINGVGDGTVLKKSAFLGDNSGSVLEYADLNHRQLINNQSTIEKIFELLGKFDIQIADAVSVYPLDDLLIFYLASPATLKVNDLSLDNGDLQFVVIPNPDGDYNAKITGTDNGKYHLYLGQITPSGNFWQTYEGQIEENETKNYEFAIDFDNPSLDPLIDENGSNHLTQAKELLEDLIQEDNNQNLSGSLGHLNSAIDSANQKKWAQEIDKIKNSIYYLSRFRRKLNDSQVLQANKAQRIMEILAAGWEDVLENQNLSKRQNAYREYRRARSYYSLATRLMRLSKRRRKNIPKIKAIFVKQSEDLVNDVKKDWRAKNYSSVEPQGYLARLFAWEGFVSRR